MPQNLPGRGGPPHPALHELLDARDAHPDDRELGGDEKRVDRDGGERDNDENEVHQRGSIGDPSGSRSAPVSKNQRSRDTTSSVVLRWVGSNATTLSRCSASQRATISTSTGRDRLDLGPSWGSKNSSLKTRSIRRNPPPRGPSTTESRRCPSRISHALRTHGSSAGSKIRIDRRRAARPRREWTARCTLRAGRSVRICAASRSSASRAEPE